MGGHKSDWVSYLVAAIYATILIGCLIGLRKNWLKKKSLLATNEYDKKRRVIRWRTRFYLTLFSAILIRIITIISAVILGKTMVLSKATTNTEFFWSTIASIASMLYFTAFTFIIWFFASLTFHRQQNIKKLITPFFTSINVCIYISTISIVASSYAASKWDLLYDYELPLFAIASIILGILFIFLTFKISMNIERERQDTVDYIEYSQRFSVTNSKPLNNQQMPGYAGNNEELNTTVSNVAPSNLNANEQKSSHVIPRLIKLSLLCALCWIVRGTYLIALRVWETTDKTPFNIPELAWEAVFYFVIEYPPSLGALILMISKPKSATANYNANVQKHYPQAKHQEY